MTARGGVLRLDPMAITLAPRHRTATQLLADEVTKQLFFNALGGDSSNPALSTTSIFHLPDVPRETPVQPGV